MQSMDKLQKYRGHLYNWYNTHPFEPLPPITVSSVDSGNLVASLYTLRAGAIEQLQRPVLSNEIFRGLETHWKLLQLQKDVPQEISKLRLPAASATVYDWCAWASETESLGGFAQAPAYSEPSPDELAWWLN